MNEMNKMMARNGAGAGAMEQKHLKQMAPQMEQMTQRVREMQQQMAQQQEQEQEQVRDREREQTQTSD